MSLVDLARPRGESHDMDRLFDQLEAILEPITRKDVLNGRLIQGVELLTGQPNSVGHRLGRKLRGWIVVGKDATADVWDGQASNDIPSKVLVLHSSANVNVTLWVF